MKIIYLASFKANHPGHDIIYQDINGKRDISGDMMEIDLSPYDVIIATPPCNYYSRANYRRETSEYSQMTKHLLPNILKKLIKLNKPFIFENVRSPKIFSKLGLFSLPLYIYIHGRHTYWTNVAFNPSNIKQENEYKLSVCKKLEDGTWLKTGQIYVRNMSNISSGNRQGGQNVHNVIEYWIQTVKAYD